MNATIRVRDISPANLEVITELLNQCSRDVVVTLSPASEAADATAAA